MKLYLWQDEDCKSRPTLMITITDPNDECNATVIHLGTHKKPKTTSYIEEVHDNDLEKDF